MKISRFFSLIALPAMLMGLISAGQGWGAEQDWKAVQAQKVLVLPFKMNSAQDMTYLQQGIMDMLISRLSWGDKVVVLPKDRAHRAFDRVGGKVDQARAQTLGRGVGADYVLFGSVTILGQSVSLDVSALSLSGTKPPLIVFAQLQGLDGIIPQVNKFADEINVKLFGREPQARVSARPPKPNEQVPAHRRHPDHLLPGKKGPRSVSLPSPSFVRGEAAGKRSKLWRSPVFPKVIVGLDVGDLDGDQKNEIVYASRQAVFAARVEGGRIVELARYKGNRRDRFLTVDAADINGDGRPEIFVSNQNDFRAGSLVLEFKNNKLVPIVKNSRWYFRVARGPSGPRLLGQRGGTGTRFYQGVHTMRFSQGEYIPERTLDLPEQANLFNFHLADLTGTANENLIVVDDDGALLIMSQSGKELWKSKEYYAGTMNYLEEPVNAFLGTETEKESRPKRFYLPARILSADLNGDGKKEIIIARNKRAGHSKILYRMRKFEHGSLYSLSFDDLSVIENWHSRELPGYLADYHIKDYNNDGRLDLVTAMVLKHGRGFGKKKSLLIAYEMAAPEETRRPEAERRRQ